MFPTDPGIVIGSEKIGEPGAALQAAEERLTGIVLSPSLSS
jgi:hypothetical protein